MIKLKIKYKHSGVLLPDNDILMYKIKAQHVDEDFSNNKEMFDFSNYLTKSKDYVSLSK